MNSLFDLVLNVQAVPTPHLDQRDGDDCKPEFNPCQAACGKIFEKSGKFFSGVGFLGTWGSLVLTILEKIPTIPRLCFAGYNEQETTRTVATDKNSHSPR